MIYEFVKTKLAAMPLAEVEKAALKAGLSYRTVQKIRSGEIKNPAVQKIEALHAVLKARKQ